MGALVAVVNKKGESAVPIVVDMLKELTHRGRDYHGISTPEMVATNFTLESLELINPVSNIALGHNLSRLMPRDHPQPIKGNGFTFVFEGRLFPAPNLPGLSEAQKIIEKLSCNLLRNSRSILEKMDGSYVFAVAESDKLIVGRDVLGITPLYYGENDTLCAVASERKSLWKLGLKDVSSFPPGQLAIVNKQGFSLYPVKKLCSPPKEKLEMETAACALELLLLDSTRKQVSDLDGVAVAFSGGVDSSVIAVLADHAGLNVKLISVGLENQPDIDFTKEAAESLGLPLHFETYSRNDLGETLAKVLWLIEEPNVINASIAVPFFWLAETASKLGYPVVLAGQGADELFGGYQSYLVEYEKSGIEAVEQKMFHDVEYAYRQNFQRDNQVCSYHGVELRLPFIDKYVIDFAFRLPFGLKIYSIDDVLRKRILRRVAHNLGVPSFIADKPKKAIQYTTGVTKTLRWLAKGEGLTLRQYIEKAFSRVYS
jgi:asparagine synthase (glutamine-hydrolysing)